MGENFRLFSVQKSITLAVVKVYNFRLFSVHKSITLAVVKVSTMLVTC